MIFLKKYNRITSDKILLIRPNLLVPYESTCNFQNSSSFRDEPNHTNLIPRNLLTCPHRWLKGWRVRSHHTMHLRAPPCPFANVIPSLQSQRTTSLPSLALALPCRTRSLSQIDDSCLICFDPTVVALHQINTADLLRRDQLLCSFHPPDPLSRPVHLDWSS